MVEPYTGGCACGAIRYEVVGEPIAMLDCRCRQCQRESGTGHASHLTFKDAAVAVTGEASLWRMRGDGGTLKERAFCRDCGCPTHMTFPDTPQFFVVRAASLDAPGRYQPQFTTWASAGHAWDPVNPALAAFETMPPAP
ncbi:MAG: aldehyde-activating protein [Caulobacterales bacterium 68-7]|nr:GFA family protein [Caulobacterales bacterium]OJU10370.1 MAG: aldehyde-activating protein [Caulobacterales bacterium 68-7]